MLCFIQSGRPSPQIWVLYSYWPTRQVTSSVGDHVTFVARDLVSCHLAARLIDPYGIDYGRMKLWLKLCTDHHDVCPQLRNSRHTHQQHVRLRLRVVDVQDHVLEQDPMT